jgi:hypothetical protein
MQRGDESYTRVVEALTALQKTLEQVDYPASRHALRLVTRLENCDSFRIPWFATHVLLPALALLYEHPDVAIATDAYAILVKLYVRQNDQPEFTLLLCSSINEIMHLAMSKHEAKQKIRLSLDLCTRFRKFFTDIKL